MIGVQSNGVSGFLTDSSIRGKCSHTLSQMAQKTSLLLPSLIKIVAKPVIGAVIGGAVGAQLEMIQFDDPCHSILTTIYAGTGIVIGSVLGSIWAFSDCTICRVRVLNTKSMN